MIHPQQVQQGRVDIMDVHRVLGRVITILIRCTVTHPTPHTSTGHPHRETLGIVVTSICGALSGRSSAKLTAPENQSVVQQSALFQVGQQSGDGAVNLQCVFGMSFAQVSVLIPLYECVAVSDLDEPHAGFGKATSHQALASKILGHFVVQAIEFLRFVGFLGQILQSRHFGLHPERQFVGLDAGFEGHFGGILLQLLFIERSQQVELCSLGR